MRVLNDPDSGSTNLILRYQASESAMRSIWIYRFLVSTKPRALVLKAISIFHSWLDTRFLDGPFLARRACRNDLMEQVPSTDLRSDSLSSVASGFFSALWGFNAVALLELRHGVFFFMKTRRVPPENHAYLAVIDCLS